VFSVTAVPFLVGSAGLALNVISIPPTPASNLTVTGTTNTTANLSWTPPVAGSFAIASNSVWYEVLGSNNPILFTDVNNTQTTLSVTGLTAATTYQFYIQTEDLLNVVVESNIAQGTTSTGGSLSITTNSLPPATVGTNYTVASPLATLAASGGSGSYAWNLETCTPNWHLAWTLTRAGQIVGCPQMGMQASQGFYQDTFLVRVTDTVSGNTATATLTCNCIAIGALTIVTSNLPNGTVGGMYGQLMTASGGNPPYYWAMTSAGTGLTCFSMDPSGFMTCVPAQSESVTVQVALGDSLTYNTPSLTKNLPVSFDTALRINRVDNVNNRLKLPPLQGGWTVFTAAPQINASGGTGTGYTCAILSGAMPAGLSLALSGANVGKVTGTLSSTQAGAMAPVVIQFSDSASNLSPQVTLEMNITQHNPGTRPAYNSNPANGLYCLNGQLYDTGNEQVNVRGLDRLHYDSATWGSGTTPMNVSVLNPNTCRMWNGGVVGTGGQPASYYVNILQTQNIPFGQIPWYSVTAVANGGASTTGNVTAGVIQAAASSLTPFFSQFQPIMSQMVYNMANEFLSSSPAQLAADCNAAVTVYRNAGWTCPLTIDIQNFGETLSWIGTYAASILANDPLKNIIFAIHQYSNENYVAPITSIVSSGANTVITYNSSASSNIMSGGPPDEGVILLGVGGTMGAAINGQILTVTGHGGSAGAWTLTVSFNSTGFSGTGGLCVGIRHPLVRYIPVAAYIAQGYTIVCEEFGPWGGGPADFGVTSQMCAFESYGIGQIYWASDDHSGAAGGYNQGCTTALLATGTVNASSTSLAVTSIAYGWFIQEIQISYNGTYYNTCYLTGIGTQGGAAMQGLGTYNIVLQASGTAPPPGTYTLTATQGAGTENGFFGVTQANGATYTNYNSMTGSAGQQIVFHPRCSWFALATSPQYLA
jgi:Fibronectin type III domain